MDTSAQVASNIKSGAYDTAELAEIRLALVVYSEKRDSHAATRSGLSVKDYPIGTRVRFNSHTGTRYMVGQLGTVSSIKLKKVVVTLDKAVGRFERLDGTPAKTTCPIEILDIVL